MRQLFALSAIGRDRPGIVADLAELMLTVLLEYGDAEDKRPYDGPASSLIRPSDERPVQFRMNTIHGNLCS